MRDELGLSALHEAHPLQAALASGLTFTVAAAVPLVAAAVAPEPQIIPAVVVATLVSLAGLGAMGAYAGGAPKLRATARVLFWALPPWPSRRGVGRVFGVSV